jgi:hypothetical protein
LIGNIVLSIARISACQMGKGGGFNLIFCLPKEKVSAIFADAC